MSHLWKSCVRRERAEANRIPTGSSSPSRPGKFGDLPNDSIPSTVGLTRTAPTGQNETARDDVPGKPQSTFLP